MSSEQETLDIVQWKQMVRRMMILGWRTSEEFNEWVCDCALHAYEAGDVSEEVSRLLDANEQLILAENSP